MSTQSGMAHVPLALTPLSRKEFSSDQEVRWCPGCGDYAILAAFQGMMPELGIRRENTVIVSGIGCSSRFPYYMDVYGMHGIHGRAPSIATGIATARPDLSVWVVTGDGDALAIGGNHFIHTMRRNVNITIVMLNNRIYGLTKGQYSPTSEKGKVTKSSPEGSVDEPFNPIALALGAGATFVARALDSDRKHLSEVLKAAVMHRGTSLVEIYQNCPIFNDGSFDALKNSPDGIIPLRHGEQVIFGSDGGSAVVRDPATGTVSVSPTIEADPARIVVHDAHAADPTQAFALSQLTDHGVMRRSPVGIFRSVDRPTYDDEVRGQVTSPTDRMASLQAFITGHDTWTV